MMQSSSTNGEQKVKLVTCDNVIFEVDRCIAFMSDTLKNILVDMNDTGNEELPISDVCSVTMSKVLEYCEHHKNDHLEQQGKIVDNGKIMSEWDEKFCKELSQDLLFNLIKAANYLDIRPLLNILCKTVANMITGKTPQEIRVLFNLPNNFAEEEERIIQKEYACYKT